MPKTREVAVAFTLIELLVVVSIIGVLLALLVPSLARAREHGRRAVCGMHQRQIVNAWEAYAFDAGALPIMNRQGLDINYRKVGTVYRRQDISGFGLETWEEYLHPKNFWYGVPFRGIIFQVDIHSGMNEFDFGKWRNFGLLWDNKSITDPRGLFCPSQRDPFYAWDGPYNPWPPSLDTARRPDKPWRANHTESGFERRMGLTGVAWDRVSPRTALVTDRLLGSDPVFSDYDSTRIVAETHRDGVTAAFRGGHVVFIRDDEFRTWTPRFGPYWTDTQSRAILMLYDWLDHQSSR